MGLFNSIPVRSNADTGLVTANWWNDIRTALINAFGSGIISETQGTIADGSSAYTDITGLLLDSSVNRCADIEYTIMRTTGAASRRERGILRAMFKTTEGTWTYERQSFGDDALGNGTVADSLKVSSTGQVQYKSDSMGGTYVGRIRYKIVTAFEKET